MTLNFPEMLALIPDFKGEETKQFEATGEICSDASLGRLLQTLFQQQFCQPWTAITCTAAQRNTLPSSTDTILKALH